MRPARLATAILSGALAVGLVQAPALAADGQAAGGIMVAKGDGSAVTTGTRIEIRDDVVIDPTDPSVPPADPTVAAPTNLAYELVGNSVTITFVPPETDQVITNYEWSDSGGVWFVLDPAVTSSPARINNLQPGQPYSISLRAVTADGPGAASEPIDFRIDPPRPPKPPRPISFEVDGDPLGKAQGAKVVTLKPGSILKIRNVPEGATVSIVDKKKPACTVAVRETSKARMWTTDVLPPACRFWVTITDADGNRVPGGRINFKMGKAEKTFAVDVWPTDKNVSQNMGAGIPLIVDFGVPITNKEAVEKALVVTSDKDFGEAGWFWASSTKAVFRPRSYWPGNASITLTANLASVQGAKGVYGTNVSKTFKTGDQVVLKVNLSKHTMKYTRNGVEERTFKISGGKSGWLTEAGTKILTAHIPDKRLYNPDPEEGWDVTVKWAIRVNDNGEYIHDATWNYSIGYANTSHGCTNMTYDDMGWLFRNTKFGDIAEYTGSTSKIGTDDYLAGYWNYTWPEWKRGSALFKDS
ncbi:MAG: Ig-like domain-containing protein [Candidatus Nanopelagicales bacterium]